MSQTPYYLRFYDQADIRKEDIGNEERVPVTLELIPDRINSLLDIGCGDGTIIKHLKPSISLIAGLDISYTALKLAKAHKLVLSSSNYLPFRDNEFDIILSTELLEHLPDKVYRLTLHEIQRVAGSYILISVPYKEDLNRKQTRCIKCGNTFHIHLHLRSFDFQSLEKLFPSYFMKAYRFSGPREKTFPPWVLLIRRQYGQRWEWDPNALCPQCGHKNPFPPKRSMISVTTSLIGQIVGESHPKWISVLYVKK